MASNRSNIRKQQDQGQNKMRGPRTLGAAFDLINAEHGLSYPVVRLNSGKERTVYSARRLAGLDGFLEIKTVPDVNDRKPGGMTLRLAASAEVVAFAPRPAKQPPAEG